MSLSAAAPDICRSLPWWTLKVSGAVRGVSLARESGMVLLRDENHWLYLLNSVGSRQSQLKAPKELTVSTCSDDGSTLLVGGKEGDVWSLAPDLMPRRQCALGKRIEALAVSPLGDYLAVADAGGGVSLFTRKLRPVWSVQSPRALKFLAFIPEKPFLVGSADYGLVAAFDMKGTMTWRDGLVAHVGSLAVSDDGSSIVLACYTDGLYRYALDHPKPERQPLPDACRLAALRHDGKAVLTAGLTSTMQLLDHKGRTLGEHQGEAPATAIALSALADRFVMGTAAGLVQGLRWK